MPRRTEKRANRVASYEKFEVMTVRTDLTEREVLVTLKLRVNLVGQEPVDLVFRHSVALDDIVGPE